MSPAPILPRWARDVAQSVAVQPHVVLSGNVHDLFLVRTPDAPARFLRLNEVLWTALEPLGYEALLAYDPVDGLRATDDSEASQRVLDDLSAARGPTTGVEGLIDLLTRLRLRQDIEGSGRIAVVVESASRIVREREQLDPVEHDLFARAWRRAMTATALPVPTDASDREPIHDVVVWAVEDVADLPTWFVSGTRAVRHVPVPTPGLGDRWEAAEQLADEEFGDGSDGMTSDRDRFTQGLVDESHGLGVSDLLDAVRLARHASIPPERVADAVRALKVGVLDDPWADPSLPDRIRTRETEVRERILGQDRAITRAFDILKRTVLGLSGAQVGRSGRPRGVLFLAGPTGTGKTELARQLSQTVFASEDAYLRFDMSEFSAEHTQARLIGAPPGYVGFGAGGELTRAVREQPFRLLLFDEIEKAHGRILDKFLQILDDGRLTDGRGETVHFSETLIVFTSNLGIGQEDDPRGGATPSTPSDEMEATVRAAVERYFDVELGRPELLGRIGDNIVVLDFLRGDVVPAVLDGFLRNVVTEVEERLGIALHLADRARADLLDLATRPEVTARGARGMSTIVESNLLDPLARELFRVGADRGADLTVERIVMDAEGVRIELRGT
jgi:hypothetical protein